MVRNPTEDSAVWSNSVESEAQAVERETQAWTDGMRLSQPGYQPNYGDLLASFATSHEICARLAANPANTPAETKYLEAVNTRIEKQISDVQEHAQARDA